MLLDLKISFKELTSFHRLEACATNLCYYNFVFAIAWPGDKCKQEYEGCLGMLIYSSALPYFREIRELVEMGLAPGGLHRNREFRMHMIEVGTDCPDCIVDILFDPQAGCFFPAPTAG